VLLPVLLSVLLSDMIFLVNLTLTRCFLVNYFDNVKIKFILVFSAFRYLVNGAP